jgi:CubicO group peptidase (beta-lactamase class C family)
VVAVAKDGKLVFERGFGYADVEGLVEMTPDHIMRVASISKVSAQVLFRLFGFIV